MVIPVSCLSNKGKTSPGIVQNFIYELSVYHSISNLKDDRGKCLIINWAAFFIDNLKQRLARLSSDPIFKDGCNPSDYEHYNYLKSHVYTSMDAVRLMYFYLELSSIVNNGNNYDCVKLSEKAIKNIQKYWDNFFPEYRELTHFREGTIPDNEHGGMDPIGKLRMDIGVEFYRVIDDPFPYLNYEVIECIKEYRRMLTCVIYPNFVFLIEDLNTDYMYEDNSKFKRLDSMCEFVVGMWERSKFTWKILHSEELSTGYKITEPEKPDVRFGGWNRVNSQTEYSKKLTEYRQINVKHPKWANIDPSMAIRRHCLEHEIHNDIVNVMALVNLRILPYDFSVYFLEKDSFDEGTVSVIENSLQTLLYIITWAYVDAENLMISGGLKPALRHYIFSLARTPFLPLIVQLSRQGSGDFVFTSSQANKYIQSFSPEEAMDKLHTISSEILKYTIKL